MTACLEYQDVYGPVLDYTAAWNGGARSNAEFPADGWFGWSVPRSAVGVALGLNTENTGEHYIEFSHAFMFQRGSYRILEQGVTKLGPVVYTEGDRFYLMRVGALVLYMLRPAASAESLVYFDGRAPAVQLPGYVIWASTLPSTGTIFLDASIYSANDQVVDEAAGYVWYPGIEGASAVSPDPNAGGANISFTFDVVGSQGIAATSAVGYAELEFSLLARTTLVPGAELELPFTVFAADVPLTAFFQGELPFEVTAYGSDPASQPQIAGSIIVLPFEVEGGTSIRRAGAELELPFEVFGTISKAAQPVTTGAFVNVSFDVFGTSSDNVQTPATAGAFVSIPFEVFGTSSDNVQTPATAGAFVNVPFDVFGWTTGDEELPVGAVGYVGIPFEVTGLIEEPNTNSFSIALSFSPQSNQGVDESVEVRELFYALTVPIQANYANAVRERIRAISTAKTFYTQTTSVMDQAFALARYEPAFVQQIAETISVDNEVTFTQLVAIAERLVATGVAQTVYSGIVQVVAAALAQSSVVDAYSGSISEEIEIEDDALALARRIAALTDQLAAASNMEYVLTLVANETSTAAAADSTELTASLLAALMDEVDVYSLMKTPAEITQGWVMNTEGSQPISEYDNYTFGSMTSYKGKFYGTTDTGLYEMGADTDAGDAITAQLASMMLDFGTSRQKRIRSAYLGYTSTNELVLKVRSVSNGQLFEHWFKACPVPADAPREGRVHVGQGLRSRYWQFELTNVDGGDFEIDQLEMYPLVLSRRV